MIPRKDVILDEIAREEARLADLDRAREAARTRLASLKSALDAVSPSSAPLLDCYLITETMSRRHELSMDSYDRLFPNQDTMPRGSRKSMPGEAPLGFGEPPEETVVEYDEEALRHFETDF